MTTPSPARYRALGLCMLLASLSFVLDAASARANATFVLPWVSPSIGALAQSTDLYLFNPGPDPMSATLVFRKRGTPDVNPPTTHRTVAPGATLYVSDVLQLFKGARVAGSVVATVSGDVAPVVASFTSTFNARGKRLAHAAAAASADVAGPGESQYLVGLRQDASFSTTIWLSNPTDGPAAYALEFLAVDGSVLGRLPAVQVGPGLIRELDPAQLPLPAGARTGPFTIRVAVDRGGVLSAAQVFDKATSDAAFVQGQTR